MSADNFRVPPPSAIPAMPTPPWNLPWNASNPLYSDRAPSRIAWINHQPQPYGDANAVELKYLRTTIENTARLVEELKADALKRKSNEMKEEPPIKRVKPPSDEETQKARNKELGEFLRKATLKSLKTFYCYKAKLLDDIEDAENGRAVFPIRTERSTADTDQAAFQALGSLLPLKYYTTYCIAGDWCSYTVCLREEPKPKPMFHATTSETNRRPTADEIRIMRDEKIRQFRERSMVYDRDAFARFFTTLCNKLRCATHFPIEYREPSYKEDHFAFESLADALEPKYVSRHSIEGDTMILEVDLFENAEKRGELDYSSSPSWSDNPASITVSESSSSSDGVTSQLQSTSNK